MTAFEKFVEQFDRKTKGDQIPIWSSVEPYLLYRIVTDPPSPDSKYSRIINVAWIEYSPGRVSKFVLPYRAWSENHIFWKIYNTLAAKYFQNPKGCTPDEMNLINEVVAPNSKDKMNKGWKGQELVIMQGIDRLNGNHVTIWSKGRNSAGFYNPGLPRYGVVEQLVNLIKTYGDWRNYDIFIKKEPNSVTVNPYKIINASIFKGIPVPEIPPEVNERIEDRPLTPEEASLSLHDLDKIIPYSSYSKLYEVLGKKIKQIDEVFGTSFYKELEREAAKENIQTITRDETAEIEIENPTNITNVKSIIKDLPGYRFLTEEQIDSITSVDLVNKRVVIEGQSSSMCSYCRGITPDSFDKGCLFCGREW